ncbi:PucR family transcriptional regulator [Streptomyces canus]
MSSVLRDLAEQRHHSPEDARARVAALGLPTEGGFVAVLVDCGGKMTRRAGVASGPGTTDRGRARTRRCAGPRAARCAAGAASPTALATHGRAAQPGWNALVGALAPGRLGVLPALPHPQPWRPTVERLSRAARGLGPDAVVSIGAEVADLFHAPRSFREAERVAESALPGLASPDGRSFHELSDLGLRRLLCALREDIRVQDYAERQLGRLVDHDTRHGTDPLTTLRPYLDAVGNKTTAARRGGLSRDTVYQHRTARGAGRT